MHRLIWTENIHTRMAPAQRRPRCYLQRVGVLQDPEGVSPLVRQQLAVCLDTVSGRLLLTASRTFTSAEAHLRAQPSRPPFRLASGTRSTSTGKGHNTHTGTAMPRCIRAGARRHMGRARAQRGREQANENAKEPLQLKRPRRPSGTGECARGSVHLTAAGKHRVMALQGRKGAGRACLCTRRLFRQPATTTAVTFLRQAGMGCPRLTLRARLAAGTSRLPLTCTTLMLQRHATIRMAY